MQSATKYLFDRDFDDLDILKEIVEQEEEELERDKAEAAEAEEEDAPPAPTYSEEELAAARQQGHDQGRQEGIAETLGSFEQRITNSIEKVANQLDVLFRIQAEANEATARDAVALSLAMVRKLFSTINEKNGLDEIARVSRDVLSTLLREPRVLVLVNEDAAEPIRERLTTFLETRGFQGELIIRGDDALGPGDCRIEWASGDAIRDASAILSEMDAIVERYAGQSLSEFSNTERDGATVSDTTLS